MVEVEIEGTKFRFAKLPGRSGMKLATRVVKMIGPLMADVKGGDASAAIAAFASADENDILGIADMLGPVSQMEVEPGKWVHLVSAMQDQHFAGKTKLFFSWLGHCTKDQLSDFFA
jgi:hypothetical protein